MHVKTKSSPVGLWSLQIDMFLGPLGREGGMGMHAHTHTQQRNEN